jgi:ADP-L-glycero-D-manno-heptose 6-epimerase
MIVVTGAAGFIGSCFVRYLNNEGITELLLVDEFGTSDRWKNLLGKKFKSFFGKDDFLDLLQKGKLPHDITAIVHLGACSSTLERDVDYLYKNNYLYSRILCEFAIERGIQFIYASSAATYGDGTFGYSDDHSLIPSLKPLNPYGFSKQLFDLWALENNLLDRITGLKFFNVYGPNEYHKGEMRSVVLKSFEQIKREGSVKLFKSYKNEFADGEQKRDFLYVKDCCGVMSFFLKNPSVSGIFNIGSGKAESWNTLVNSVFEALGEPPQIEYIDMPEGIRDQYQYFTEAPLNKLRKAGYTDNFRSIKEGTKDYVLSHLITSDAIW